MPIYARTENIVQDSFAISSSVSGDVWHGEKPGSGCQRWYFDALSDDRGEALVIVFTDNFSFSPRRNGSHNPETAADGVPALAFTYFRDGKLACRTVRRFSPDQFDASRTEPYAKIGNSAMTFRSASYGSGYQIEIDAELRSGRRLRANLEWLTVESDFKRACGHELVTPQTWNVAAPRCDVTGKMELTDRRGRQIDIFQFRGTGYHHNQVDIGDLAARADWGRAHFTDATAVFYRRRQNGSNHASAAILLVQSGCLDYYEARLEQSAGRTMLGLRNPSSFRLISDDDLRLSVEPLQKIDTCFNAARFLSRITLTRGDGSAASTLGITEFASGPGLAYRLLDRLPGVRDRPGTHDPMLKR